MAIKLKTSTSNWATLKKVWGKTGTSTWSPAKAIFAKLATGWQQVWPGNTPAVSPTDPINIRLTSYNGAIASSPQYINTKLYGNDGSFTGTTPITISGRKMRVASDATGNATRYVVENSDVFDMSNSTATDRYFVDGWYLFYELTATNTDGDLNAFSPPIKIIKRVPQFSDVSLTGIVGTGQQLRFNFTAQNFYYNSPDYSNSYVRWWRNTSNTPGGIVLKTDYLTDVTRVGGAWGDGYSNSPTSITGYSTYNVASADTAASTYLIAELVLVNSYHDHYGGSTGTFLTGDAPPASFAWSILNGGTFPTAPSAPILTQYINDVYIEYASSKPGDTSYYTTSVSGSAYGSTLSSGDFFINSYGLGPVYNYPTGPYELYVPLSPSANNSPLSVFVTAEGIDRKALIVFGTANARSYTINYTRSGGSSGNGTFSTTVNGTFSPTMINEILYIDTTTTGGTVTVNSVTAYSGINGTGSSTVGSVDLGPSITPFFRTNTGPTTTSNFTYVPQISRPTSLTATTNRSDGVNLVFSGSTNATGYDIFWNTAASATPQDTATPDFTNVSSPFLDTTISVSATRWYWVRGRGPSGVSGWFPLTTGVQGTRVGVAPTGGIAAVTPTTGTAGSTTYTASTSGWSGSGTISFSYSWQYFSSSSFSYVQYSTGTTFSPPSNINSLYPNFGWQMVVTASNGISPNGTASTSFTVNTPVSKLATPTGVNATDTRTDGVNVTWNAVSGAAYYGVWYGGAPAYDSNPDFGGPNNPTLITGTSYLDTSISAGSSRDYYVQAFASGNPAGTKSEWGGPNNGTRTVALPLPSTPTGLSATTNRSTDVFISWNASANASTYEIWWGGPPSDSNTADFFPGSSTFYFDNGISQGSSRTYYVRARNSVGASPWSGGATGTRTNPVVVVSPPSGLSINLSFSSGPSWSGSWSASGATSYSWTFYTADNSSGTNATFRSSGSGTSMSFSGGSQVWGKVYVTATNSGGSISGESAWV